MQVRLARDDELADIGELTVAAYQPFVSGPGGYVEELRNAEARAREAELWVAVDGDDLLGTVTLCSDGSPWREIALGDEGEFRMLAVAPGAQGRGVGLTLVQHVLDRFRERGATGIVLSSLAEMSTAHRLYERLGFVRAPARDWMPEPGVQLVAYVKELP